jgi:hypothetical protein
MKRRRTAIVHGNCQAEAIAGVLGKDPTVSAALDVVYSRSYIHPVEGKWEQRDRDVENCAVLYEQHGPQGFPRRGLLPEHCTTITFPSIDLNVLWPFNCPNPYNRSEPPAFPFGPFPYGDRIVIGAIDKGMQPDEIAEYYRKGWDEFKMDLDRLLAIDAARLTARDEHCKVKMAPYVLESFARRRLFWTVHHPVGDVVEELVDRLLRASGRVDPHLADADIAETLGVHFGQRGPLGNTDVPIHPRIAEHFNLEWYDPAEKVRSWDGTMYSFDEYFREMVRYAYAFKEERQRA